MAQDISHFLERTAVLKKPASQRMAKCMGARMGQPDALISISDHTSDGIGTDRLIMRCEAPNEDRRVARGRPLVAQIVGQRLARALRQRQDVLAS